jgi:mannose-1-phosphate guanylyltransferase
MNEMRQLYFPRHLNRTPAHLTLFHALPHSQIEALEQSLKQLSFETRPFSVTTGGPFRMRKGVGVNVDEGYQNLKAVHQQLRSQWLDFLSEQDAGGFRPHWTVMNKVDAEEEVDGAFQAVRQELSQRTKEGQAVGLELWKYDRGNWIWANEYTFGETAKGPARSQPQAATSHDAGHLSPSSSPGPSGEQTSGPSNKRPGLMKRGSSVADTWRSMSFLRKS